MPSYRWLVAKAGLTISRHLLIQVDSATCNPLSSKIRLLGMGGISSKIVIKI